jgi:hypothetical protein
MHGHFQTQASKQASHLNRPCTLLTTLTPNPSPYSPRLHLCIPEYSLRNRLVLFTFTQRSAMSLYFVSLSSTSKRWAFTSLLFLLLVKERWIAGLIIRSSVQPARTRRTNRRATRHALSGLIPENDEKKRMVVLSMFS